MPTQALLGYVGPNRLGKQALSQRGQAWLSLSRLHQAREARRGYALLSFEVRLGQRGCLQDKKASLERCQARLWYVTPKLDARQGQRLASKGTAREARLERHGQRGTARDTTRDEDRGKAGQGEARRGQARLRRLVVAIYTEKGHRGETIGRILFLLTYVG